MRERSAGKENILYAAYFNNITKAHTNPSKTWSCDCLILHRYIKSGNRWNLFIQSLVMIRYREIKSFKFADVFRIFISGSSATGKTYFAKALLKRNIFNFSRIYYFHPKFMYSVWWFIFAMLRIERYRLSFSSSIIETKIERYNYDPTIFCRRKMWTKHSK